MEDLTGKTFNYWTVLGLSPKTTSYRDHYWFCKCKCGTEREVAGSSLKKGKSKSCGCIKKEKPADYLLGKQIDNLYIEELLEKRNSSGVRLWKCKCKCGNYCIRSTTTLHRKNYFHSCGCYNIEKLKKVQYKNLVNQRFNLLVVEEELPKRDSFGCILWKCKCDCGNQIVLPTNSLTTGNTSSCGCINYSIGEKNIENILKKI